MNLDELASKTRERETQSIRPNSLTTYKHYLQSYKNTLVEVFHEDPFPVDDRKMRGFLQYVSEVKKPPTELNTIKLYIASFSYHFAVSHLPDLTKDPAFKKFVKAIRLEKGDFPPNRKSPITGSMLDQIIKNEIRIDNLKVVRNIAMMCLAHAGFLRCSELLNIHYKDLSINHEEKSLKIFLPVSKTDPTSEGINVYIGFNNTDHSPYVWLNKYLQMLEKNETIEQNDLLFPISRSSFSLIIKRYTQINRFVGNFSPHSLRRGGAHDAFEQNIPEASIKQHGRWKSSVYMIYTEVERQTAGQMITTKI